MYIPQSFSMIDKKHITTLIQEHSFATLIHIDKNVPVISHVPLYLDQEQQTLVGHLAKNNPHVSLLDQPQAYVILHGT